jgi:DNA polymerase (family 10)
MPVDFFATTPDCWFVALVLRTGPKELNTMLAASALRRGMQLHAYGVLEVTATGEPIIPESEREVFQRLGVPYREPAQR